MADLFNDRAFTTLAEPDWPVDDPGPPEPEGDDAPRDAEGAIAYRMTALRIDREARRRLDDEERPKAVPPPVKTLNALLAEPDTPTRYRIEGVAPTGGRVMLSAQYKAGKTTIVGNLARSLVDGDPFLGKFTIHDPARHLVLIDDELSEDTLRHWLRSQNIADTSAVADVVALRGNVAAFNLLDDRCRAGWARRLADVGCDYLVLDCLRPVLDALGLDEHRDAGQFLVAFDALLAEAGIQDALTVQHMGHSGERARGDSRLQDWPDAIWRLVRETEEPGSPRYFTAYGRDVNVPEGRLSFDPETRRLTYAEGSRVDAQAEEALTALVFMLAEGAKTKAPGMSARAIEAELVGDHPRAATRDAIREGVKRGHIAVEIGARRARIHRIAHPCSECGRPVTPGRDRHESCPLASSEGLLE